MYIKFNKFINNHSYIKYITLFIIVFLYFSYFLNIVTILDPDGFYHLKIAELINEFGIVKDFKWLQYSTLKSNYVDQSLLYHYFLAGLLKIFNPLIAIKILSVTLSSFFVLIFYKILKTFKIKNAWFFILLLITNTPFIYRLLLPKATPFALIALVIFLYFLFKNNRIGLFLISTIYIFIHGGFLILIAIAVLYILAKIIINSFDRGISFYRIFNKESFILLSLTVVGIIFGIILSPYSNEILEFIKEQFFQIGVFTNTKLFIGIEWMYYPYLQFYHYNLLVILVYIFTIIYNLVYFKKIKTNTLLLFFLSFIFLAFSIKSRRFIEYFIPIAILFTAFSFNNFYNYILEDYRQIIKRKIFKITLFIIILIPVIFSFYQLKQFNTNYKSGGYSFNKFENSSKWLKNNTEKNEIVYNVYWDSFPLMFYYNDKNLYIAGLDPVFSYDYIQDLYLEYEKIAYSKDAKDIAKTIKNKFRARYIFFEKGKSFPNNFEFNEKFDKVYEDNGAIIYKIK